MADSNETVTIATGEGAPGSTLLGIGAYRPQRVVSNEEICETIDSTSEWIYERSGILNRRFASGDESIVMMSTEAARKAVASAGIDPELVDAVILCTSTNWTQVPHAAPQVATNLGRNGIAAFDLTAGCAGFGYGLAVATNMIRGGASRYVVVIGVEKMSDGIDFTDRNTSFIFGDGAGAVVVGPAETNDISPVVWGSDGEQGSAISQTKDFKAYVDEVDSGAEDVRQPFLTMNGSKVFRWAAVQVSKVCAETLETAGVTAEQIQAFVPHQANGRINSAMAKHLGLPDTVAIANDIEQTGNTSAASIPLAMETMLREGQSKQGDVALCIGFGAGLSYAGQVVRLPAAPPVD
ncbi:beta-ketoacyl ACP synthase [Dietzia kunjamensis subsp. schimae]|uniref:Beta-ketoacyl-[acyl-carrier-protein] synthase III n=1 Tax=Dietzia kunjamensis subsp. schimae TaxID=498198 RepID=A0ABY1N556_9ACTN|nr:MULTISPECIES: beta-ketoacyl-ACP synthase III [Dietzia]MBB1016418.1 ketoacyl-ACP synthase III [Dietzia kunjamensis subsp. schimae]SMO92907.1 beta-ketoacyl ACP synthase [Dietzia kunjamensis subsp. schimae]